MAFFINDIDNDRKYDRKSNEQNSGNLGTDLIKKANFFRGTHDGICPWE